MARTAQTSIAASPQEMLRSLSDWFTQCVEGSLRAQKFQLDVLQAQSEFAWRTHAQVTATANELWDGWVARWGGGVLTH